ncbi:hypothetical protein LI328DRAFT_140311 [Trichoderma asperelloides]|nr:hypothetical protein LI328DRAFT_140311 [Trichoderma asperelloides]
MFQTLFHSCTLFLAFFTVGVKMILLAILRIRPCSLFVSRAENSSNLRRVGRTLQNGLEPPKRSVARAGGTQSRNLEFCSILISALPYAFFLCESRYRCSWDDTRRF